MRLFGKCDNPFRSVLLHADQKIFVIAVVGLVVVKVDEADRVEVGAGVQLVPFQVRENLFIAAADICSLWLCAHRTARLDGSGKELL